MDQGDDKGGISRRGIIKASGSAAVVVAAQQIFPSGVLAAG
ncbi:MAG: twin-arginine translocation signal domain-containing protein [Sphingobium sp.]